MDANGREPTESNPTQTRSNREGSISNPNRIRIRIRIKIMEKATGFGRDSPIDELSLMVSKDTMRRLPKIPVISVEQMRQWEEATWAAGRTPHEVIGQVGRLLAQRILQLTRPSDAVWI